MTSSWSFILHLDEGMLVLFLAGVRELSLLRSIRFNLGDRAVLLYSRYQ